MLFLIFYHYLTEHIAKKSIHCYYLEKRHQQWSNMNIMRIHDQLFVFTHGGVFL